MTIEESLTGGQLNPAVAEYVINEVTTSLGCSLPPDYVQFIREHNGGEGFIGLNYIILWKAEELATFNREYEVEKLAPGILLFASNGGGEAYGFDTRDTAIPVVRVPFIGMDRLYARVVASSFTDLFTQLASGHG